MKKRLVNGMMEIIMKENILENIEMDLGLNIIICLIIKN